jgi:hypothetical protein
MIFVKRLKEGEMLPAWYGVAFYDFATNRMVAAPIPFNVIFVLLRKIYVYIRSGIKTVYFEPREAYWQGYTEGKKDSKPL